MNLWKTSIYIIYVYLLQIPTFQDNEWDRRICPKSAYFLIHISATQKQAYYIIRTFNACNMLEKYGNYIDLTFKGICCKCMIIYLSRLLHVK